MVGQPEQFVVLGNSLCKQRFDFTVQVRLEGLQRTYGALQVRIAIRVCGRDRSINRSPIVLLTGEEERGVIVPHIGRHDRVGHRCHVTGMADPAGALDNACVGGVDELQIRGVDGVQLAGNKVPDEAIGRRRQVSSHFTPVAGNGYVRLLFALGVRGRFRCRSTARNGGVATMTDAAPRFGNGAVSLFYALVTRHAAISIVPGAILLAARVQGRRQEDER